MKKTASILIIAVMLTAGFATPAYSDHHRHGHRSDRGWATVGKALTGMAGVALLADLIASPVCYREYQPRPLYVERPCPPPARWVEGHYVQYEERIWIPGENRKIWIEPIYTWERHHGRNIRVYHEGYYRYEEMPGRYDICVKERWVEGHWE